VTRSSDRKWISKTETSESSH